MSGIPDHIVIEDQRQAIAALVAERDALRAKCAKLEDGLTTVRGQIDAVSWGYNFNCDSIFNVIDAALQSTGENKAEWTKKRKGSAIIHKHPNVPHGIVQNHWGIHYNGVEYKTLESAKEAALQSTGERDNG